ncbi:CsbD family protein [Crenothrix sp.]|uniref:CsbD family protein n=1 Tax=Crenothrix sp. TaxID=3100433 RepID=UPI00374D44EE
MKIIGLCAAILLTSISFGSYAEEVNSDTTINQDQLNGKVEQTKGKVKEATGVLTDDKDLKTEGNVQKNVGKAQEGIGDVKEKMNKDIKEGN